MDTIQHQSLDDLIKQDKGFRGGRGGRGGFRGGRGGRGGRGRPDIARGGAQRALDVGRQNKRGGGIFKKRDGRPTPGGRPQSQGFRQQEQRNNNLNQSVNRGDNRDDGEQNRQRIRKRLAAIRKRQNQNNNQGNQNAQQDRPFHQNKNTGQNQRPQQKPQKQSQSPVQARKGTGPSGNQTRVGGKTLKFVQGTLQQRKIRVTNIDAKTVTNQDLNKLFSKCGPMVQARFDTNEHGQYLGTATIIYAKASAALRAIDDFNGASLDNRVMKVAYADDQARTNIQAKPFKRPGQQAAQQRSDERRENSLKPRFRRGGIHKNRGDRAQPSNEGGQRKPLLGDDQQQSRQDKRRAIRDRRRGSRK